MTAAHVMVILTLLGDGQLSAAFVSTESRQNCEMRAKPVEAILKASKTEIRYLQCLPSDFKFDRFTHGPSSSGTHYTYLLSVGDRYLDVARVEDLQACVSLRADAPVRQGVDHYCATSTQRLREDRE